MTLLHRENQDAWQLRVFRKTLKKKLRLKAFRRLLHNMQPTDKCLLITCGDNNGAMNYYLRELGGVWFWADVKGSSTREIADFLKEEVKTVTPGALPYDDGQFDCVISIDVHEHLENPDAFTVQMARVVKTNGQILITVPGGDPKKIVNRLRQAVGMSKGEYGHLHNGFSIAQVQKAMQESGIQPNGAMTFSRFFTELVELGINFLYVKILSRTQNYQNGEKVIAPQTSHQLQSVKKSYRAYALTYPIFWLFSQLDRLLPFSEGYVVIVTGKKCKTRSCREF